MKATEREKAVIFSLAAGYIDSWQKAFILSRDYPIKQAEEIKSLAPTVTRWKQREDIQNAYNYAITALNLRDEETARKAREEASKKDDEETAPQLAGDSNRTKNAKPGRIDYYNPDNQRKTINAIIDKAQDDPKTQLDAIKAIQQTQRDDRQAAKDNQIQRFYMPVACHTCPFKAKKAKKS